MCNELYKSYFYNFAEVSTMTKFPKGKNAWTVTVGEKGQIVIPKQAREQFDIHPGDQLIILSDEKRGLAIPPKSHLTELFAKIFSDDTEE